MGRVGSYPTFSPLLIHQRYLSVALVLRSPSAGVTRYPCPVEPGLSSSAAFRLASAAVQPGRGNIVTETAANVKYLAKSFDTGYTIYSQLNMCHSEGSGTLTGGIFAVSRCEDPSARCAHSG